MIAVTGATGNLGGLVIDHLIASGLPAGDVLPLVPRPDQAAAIAGAVTQDCHIGATYNLVSPEPYSYEDLAALLNEATGRQVTHRTSSPAEVVQALVQRGMDPEHAESMVRDFQGAIATGSCRTTGRDIERLSWHSGRPTPEYIAALAKRPSPSR